MGYALAQSAEAPAQNLADAASGLAGPKLTLSAPDGHSIHILPTPQIAAAWQAALGGAAGPLVYHGGPIMTSTTIYTILWAPPTLQSGAVANMSATYKSAMELFGIDYPGHGIDNVNTQYYQTIGGVTRYIANAGGSAFYVDASPYPTAGCSYVFGPVTSSLNCLSDAQIQAEVAKVQGIKGWTPAINHIFLVYTAQGEGSCFSNGVSCAYNSFCAFHSYFGSTASPSIYGNEPYGEPAYCNIPGTPTPHNNAAADNALSAASHEVSEATTDPELNAWYTTSGAENGDLCATYVQSSMYGVNSWDSAKANQMWNGRFYEIQQEWNNHVNNCVQVGP